MKKILLLLSVLAIASTATHLNAQCSVSNFNIVIKSVTSQSNGCKVTMDITFSGNINNGNKYAFIHLWESSPVNNYPSLTYASVPTAAQLANAAATIVLQDPGKPTMALSSVYPPDPSVPVIYNGVGFSKSGTTYTLTNVSVIVSTCSQPVVLRGDTWATQSGNASVVHCYNQGTITMLLNNPLISGFKQCIVPRLLNLAFNNNNTTLAESVDTHVYLDMNSSNSVDSGDIEITSVLSPAIPNPLNLAGNTSQSFTGMSYAPYSTQPSYDNVPIIVQAIATAPGAASVTMTKTNITFLGSCISLPVTFTSFTATRYHSTVLLKWETATEQNNSGFAIETMVDNVWRQVGYVPSAAPGGNSTSPLDYQYTDANSAKGISYYRIKQVDKDNHFTFSVAKTVRGEDQGTKTIVYPNPTNNGTVNVSFDDNSAIRDISLTDMSGKTLKQWRKVTNNNIQIDNLLPGIYTLVVVIPDRGEQTVNKIVVTGR